MSRPNRPSTVIGPPAAWRFWIIAVALALLGLALVGRLLSLQVLSVGDRDYQFLQRQGDARTHRTVSLPAYRGMITDRNGQPLAVSTPVTSLWAHPPTLAEHADRLPELAKALGMPLADLRKRVEKPSSRDFVYLRRHLSPAEADRILALAVPGVSGLSEYRRYYPAGEVAAHIVGFTNVDDQGQEGMELAFDARLRGEPGAKRVVRNRSGQVIRDLGLVRAARPGGDLQLTIDLRLQYLAYRELRAAITRTKAQSGSVVVLDSRSGDILAMANWPSFNPNDRSRIRPSHLRNRAMTDLLEPGSTAKPFTLVAALESGRYTPTTPVNAAPGYIQVGDKVLKDPVNYGQLDVTGVLAKSSQVGTTRIAMTLEPDVIRAVLARVGLGEASGTGFPGESTGRLPQPRRWSAIEHATMAFGYGFAVTPLQVAQAYAVLANDGVRQPVALVRGAALPPGQRVIDSQVNAQIVDMLAAVARQGGTATRANVPGYAIAGKTGTSRKVAQTGGYSEKNYMALFAGMAPASDPHLVSVVVIDDPQGGEYYGGLVAAPVFAGVMKDALRLMQVMPDDEAAVTRVAQRPQTVRAPS